MPDAFVYYFLVRDRSTGKLVSSKRRATLEAIKTRGEPLLESQMAVDDSEVDAMGFLASRSVDGADPSGELWGEIRSLRLRAESREREAMQLTDGMDRERKLILHAESQELRSRSNRLQQLVQKQSDGTSARAIYQSAPTNGARKSRFFKPE
ncbi:MAG TPA: hypothetical protein VIY68_05660 [Steroidobacteraceae bacterium]